MSKVWGDTLLRPGLFGVLLLLFFFGISPIFARRLLVVHNLLFPVIHLVGAIVPIMKNPLQVLDYDSWWKKDLNNLQPYKIPPVSPEIIVKMEMQLEDSANRIANTRGNAESIVNHLQSLIDELKHERVFPFSWNLKVYRFPTKKT